MAVILVCDKCKKQEPEREDTSLGYPAGWVKISINVQAPVYCSRTLLLCSECIVSMGLGKIIEDKLMSTNPPIDILYDLIADIVHDNMENYGT